MASIFGAISVETPKFEVIKQLSGKAGAELRKYAPQVRAEVTYEVTPGAPIMNNLNNPFGMLAGFIFGKNTSRKAADGAANEKVAMTAPVVMQDKPSGAAAASEKVAMTAPVVMQNTTEPAASAAPAPSEKVAMTAPVVMQHATPASGASDTQQQQASTSSSTRTMSFIMPSKYSSPEDLPVPKDARVKLVQVPERTFAAVRFRGYMSDTVAQRQERELREAAAKEGVALSADPRDVQYCAFNPPWCLPWFKTNEVLIPVAGDAQ